MATAETPLEALGTSLFANRYRITRRIGRGSMADVYQGHDLLLERPVAIKLLHRHFATDSGGLEWFRLEGKTLAAIESPHVVSVYDIAIEENTAYLAMQYVAGQTLEQLVGKHGPLSPDRAATVVVQVLDGLSALHARGLAHRDLKPSNVAIDASDRVVLLDLGIASRPNGAVPETGGIAPDRRPLRILDLKSDLYQVGLLMVFLMTGVDPGKRDWRIRVDLIDRVPPGYAAIARRALAAAPNRYASATDMSRALQNAISAEQ